MSEGHFNNALRQKYDKTKRNRNISSCKQSVNYRIVNTGLTKNKNSSKYVKITFMRLKKTESNKLFL